jgi:mRNA interferase RelE/StbE
MKYRIKYRREAASYLRRLPPEWQARIMEGLDRLAEDPEDQSLDVKRLSGQRAFRLREGKYRVIFERHDDVLLILIVTIGPRGDVYKR